MQLAVIIRDGHSFARALKEGGGKGDLGRRLHALALRCGILYSHLVASNALVSVYAKCHGLRYALRVFDQIPRPDLVSWNSLLSAVHSLRSSQALLRRMARSTAPDYVTLITLLSSSLSSETVRQLHCYAVTTTEKCSFPSALRNALISAYGRCSCLTPAQHLFDEDSTSIDKVSWNALISAYALSGHFHESISLLRRMQKEAGSSTGGSSPDVVSYTGIISSLAAADRHAKALELFRELVGTRLRIDVVTVASILPAVAGLQWLLGCKEIHAYSCRHALESSSSDVRIRNALVSVYSKCGSILSSNWIFTHISCKDVISWSSMVSGYAQNEHYNEALATFRAMTKARVKPNPITITSVLSACGGVAAFKLGKEVHSWAVRRLLDDHTFVGSALISMYAKCGCLDASSRVFDLVDDKNLVTWNTLIGGYAIHGLAERAINLFRRLEGPDDVSFIAVLSACSHAGLVEEGIRIFQSMTADFNVSPRQAHFACVVDMLGRSGRLDEALNLLKMIPSKELSMEMLGSLLGACKLHSNVEIGMHAGEAIMVSNPNSGYYVLVSNMLAERGQWSGVEGMRRLMWKNGVKKTVGCSWVELEQGVHSFVSGNRASHPHWNKLFWVLTLLDQQIRSMPVINHTSN